MHCTILPRSGTRGRKAAEWTGFSLPPWTLEKWNRVSQGGRRFDKPEFARYKGNLALLTDGFWGAAAPAPRPRTSDCGGTHWVCAPGCSRWCCRYRAERLWWRREGRKWGIGDGEEEREGRLPGLASEEEPVPSECCCFSRLENTRPLLGTYHTRFLPPHLYGPP